MNAITNKSINKLSLHHLFKIEKQPMFRYVIQNTCFKNFAKFTGNHLHWSLFARPPTKKNSNTGDFL